MVHLPVKTRQFVGRERELAALERAFENAVGVVVRAVHGLGGVGKSTLAAHWAAGQTGAFDVVWWITAETEADLDAGLADLAVALQPALGDVLSRKALRDLAVRWLSANTGWLLVLDNVSAPADVRWLLGRATGGRFLVTTRQAAGWQGIAETLSLDVLELPEAVELFEQVYGGPVDGVEELCRELGCLPLAVEQAAAYCREARITPGNYHRQLAAHPGQILTKAPEGGRTIARVWRVTLDRLADTPLAGHILLIMAWWAPDGIHRSYLEPLAGGSPPDVTEALRRLAAHSMITLHDDGTLSVHRLVQAVARAEDPEDPHRSPERVRAARDLAAVLLNARADRGHLAWGWITHAQTLLGHVAPEEETEQIVLLLCNMSVWFPELGKTALAARAATAAERVCGERHKVTLLAREYLAGAYEKAGEFDRALTLLRKNVSITVRMNGRKHPDTFQARARLTRPMLMSGDLKGGLAWAEKTVRRAERHLGAAHEVTLEVAQVLAGAWVTLAEADPDRYASAAVAEVERRRIQAIRAEGEDGKIACFMTLHLKELHELRGDIRQALAMAEALVVSAGRHYGELNALTLSARMSHVHLLMRIGEGERVRELAGPLIADWERVFGASEASALLSEILNAAGLPPNDDDPTGGVGSPPDQQDRHRHQPAHDQQQDGRG
ncbi:tetratricopeptide repeat protein [Streptomyces sp. CA-251387]|uniref:tetratricopeptide repeat protein n=1 Tax=Streptomyces sp. CA-251387 TaxID=3240064 RepID=UPI003D94FF27